MKSLKKTLLIAAVLPLLSFASTYSSEVSERGFAGGARGSGDFERNQGDFRRDDGVNGGYEGVGGAVEYPGYGYPGGYLAPGPVDPGEDDADAIYRANQHPGE